MIALRPLREDEYADWDAAHRVEYARGLISHVGMSREDAEAKVERDVAAVLPDGLTPPGTRIWAVEDDGRKVGTVVVGIAMPAPGSTTSRSTSTSAGRSTITRW